MRLFSVPRRRPHLIDVYTPFVYGVDIYRLKWATNFDVAPTDFIDAPNIGYIDPAVPRAVVESQPTAGRQVRIVFDPASFSIPDGAPFWMQLARVVGVTETDVSPPTLILPDSAHHGVGAVVIAGNAPDEASVADSLQLDLPRLMSDIRFTNHGITGDPFLYVATEPGGAEMAVAPAADSGQVTLTLMGTESTLLVRGDNALVAFSAVLTLAFPK